MDRNSKQIIQHLLKDGFTLISVKGSHHKFARTDSEGARMVIVPHPKKDLPPGTVRAIARQAGWIK
jgi:predicted RNA binding protein YcfA (HicA-like mRNA interferase family)